jgi:hypothetical protein
MTASPRDTAAPPRDTAGQPRDTATPGIVPIRWAAVDHATIEQDLRNGAGTAGIRAAIDHWRDIRKLLLEIEFRYRAAVDRMRAENAGPALVAAESVLKAYCDWLAELAQGSAANAARLEDAATHFEETRRRVPPLMGRQDPATPLDAFCSPTTDNLAADARERQARARDLMVGYEWNAQKTLGDCPPFPAPPGLGGHLPPATTQPATTQPATTQPAAASPAAASPRTPGAAPTVPFPAALRRAPVPAPPVPPVPAPAWSAGDTVPLPVARRGPGHGPAGGGAPPRFLTAGDAGGQARITRGSDLPSWCGELPALPPPVIGADEPPGSRPGGHGGRPW